MPEILTPIVIFDTTEAPNSTPEDRAQAKIKLTSAFSKFLEKVNEAGIRKAKSEFDQACHRFVDLYKIYLKEFHQQASKSFPYEIDILIPDRMMAYWPKIKSNIGSDLEKESNSLQYHIFGITIRCVQPFYYVKVRLQNVWEIPSHLPEKILAVGERFRAVVERHRNKSPQDPDQLVSELIATATFWHDELTKAEAARREAALLEIERRAQLRQKEAPKRMSFKLLSPEEQLERVRAQGRKRQARRYARLKGSAI